MSLMKKHVTDDRSCEVISGPEHEMWSFVNMCVSTEKHFTKTLQLCLQFILDFSQSQFTVNAFSCEEYTDLFEEWCCIHCNVIGFITLVDITDMFMPVYDQCILFCIKWMYHFLMSSPLCVFKAV